VKKILITFVFLFSLFCFNDNVNAGSMSVYTNYNTITVGSYVTITVKTNQLDGKFSVTSSNTSVLSGGNSGIWLGTENPNKSFSFYANKTGTATISIVPVDVAGLDNNQAYTTTKTITINVVEKSKNNNLSSLKVDDYELTPKFSKDILEYSLELENGTVKAKISAKTEDSTAYVKGIGEVELVEGSNPFSVVVTAQNGSTKTYKLNITVKELNPINVDINGSKYTVIRKKELMPTANVHFKETTIKINEEDVPAYVNETTGMTLVGLTNESLETKLYIYENNNYRLYEEIVFNQLYIQVLPMDETLLGEGYTASKIEIGGSSLAVYTKQGETYPVLYGLNIQTGDKNLYKYDAKENTLQRLENIVVEEVETNEGLYFIIIIVLFGFIVLSYLLFIILLVKKNKKKKKKVQNIEDAF